MNKNAKIINYGLLVWLIPSFITVTLSSFWSAFSTFEIISALAVAVTAVIFSYLYFRGLIENFIKEGVLTGIIWLIISVILDLILIALGVSQLNLATYAMYVVPLYLIIPVITILMGVIYTKKK